MDYKIFKFSKAEVMARSSVIPEEENNVIVETAGFVPLDVRFKQMEQNGILARLNAQEFSLGVDDLRQLYFGAETEITQYDDLEDVQEKLYNQNVLKQQLYNEYLKSQKQNISSETEKNHPEEQKEESNKN